MVGAILVFALNFETGFINLDLVGYILMAAGAVVFVIGLVLMMRRRTAVSESRTTVDPATGSRVDRTTTTASPEDPVA